MKKILFILLALAIPVLLLAVEPIREWKSKSGQTTQASFDPARDNDPATVPIIQDGKKFRIQFDDLSKADQEYVTKVRKDGRSLNGGFPMKEESERGIEVVPAGNRYALLIGVNEYAKPIRSLRYCVNDTKLLAESFEKSGIPKENIFLVTDDCPAERRPTGENIRHQIEIVTQLMEPDDQLIISFAGHGVLIDGKSYLCPSDTNLNNKNSVISRDWAFDQLEKCKAKQKVFIIDACRDEVAFGDQRALSGARTLEDPIGADTHGFILIASCDKTQQSWEHSNLKHGVFTYFLAQGLAGAAQDEDGYVSVMNLFQYASGKTKKYVYREFNRAQVPTFRQGGEMTDFYLAKLERSNPTPIAPTPAPAPVQTTSQPPKAGERRVEKVNGVEFAFRWCPPGTFMMGSPESEKGHNMINPCGNDPPYITRETLHQVTLTKGFWILETEVTVGMFKAFVSETGYEPKAIPAPGFDKENTEYSWRNPGYSQDDNHPVTCVSWNDAVKFCKWLGEKTGQNITLPTEAQWEYACRAGSTTAFFWGNVLNGDRANCNGENPYGTTTEGKYIGKTTPVYSYASNAWGVNDMHGNVCEWCQDWFEEDYSDKSVTDPAGPSSGSERAVRGGCYVFDAEECRSARRGRNKPDCRSKAGGFRCVMSISSPEK